MEKTLEQEFAEYKEHHMYEMSLSALTILEDEGIYNSKLLEDYKDLDLKGREKAHYILDDLYEKAVEGDEKKYHRVYEMCWKKIRNRINDRMSFRIDIEYED